MDKTPKSSDFTIDYEDYLLYNFTKHQCGYVSKKYN